MPSNVPSDIPSDIPSDVPSDQPSLLPSSMPSDVPSDIPSDFPSLEPSVPVVIEASRSPCDGVSCSGRGKCEVISQTVAQCKCENTFIHSDDKLDCICPSGTKFDPRWKRCFSITTSPTKSPTKSPTLAPTKSPSQAPTKSPFIEEPCVDDMSGTFTIDNGNTGSCKWILKNKKRRAKRKFKYCPREEVVNMCPVTCGVC
ncbi:hypothetical protein CTEN210_15910 [Chaetoceros tenuissimus]|uniref:ShKT domain-containing protein n=1 Tax=Chaetoceros tenuissimus TaxID=426638 RepID=A0AAD3HDP7_9STRA|nr:hypothetical protein CTEN210_15910 [Chaetoceros tenuissimus]